MRATGCTGNAMKCPVYKLSPNIMGKMILLDIGFFNSARFVCRPVVHGISIQIGDEKRLETVKNRANFPV